MFIPYTHEKWAPVNQTAMVFFLLFFLSFFFFHKTISFIDLKQPTSQVIHYGTSKKEINTNPNVTAALRVLCVSP